MRPTEYVVVQPQIVGTVENWRTAYYSDLIRYTSRHDAIRHGWRKHGHDDWLLAHLRGDSLVMTSWQYEDRPDEDEERAEMAAEFGWVDGGRS